MDSESEEEGDTSVSFILEKELDSGPFWEHSNRTKNFNYNLSKLDKTNKRKRSKTLKPVRHPLRELSVLIHFSDDCNCKFENKLECTCNLWFEGVVKEQLEDDENGNNIFHVCFDDGQEEEITWFQNNDKNDFWARYK